MRLKGKVVLITASTRGIGLACAGSEKYGACRGACKGVK